MKQLKRFRSMFFVLSLFVSVPAFADLTGDPAGNMWNISTNPLGLLVGPNLRLDYKVADQWTAGVYASLIYVNLSSVKMNGSSAGVSASYYFNQVYQRGWFLEGGVDYSNFRAKYIEDNGTEDHANVTNISIPIIGGYKWFWGHFNLALGLGPTINFPSTREIKDQNGNDKKSIPGGAVGVGGEASIGWTF
jgi:hypothetical protein